MAQATAALRSSEARILTTQSSRLWGLDWSVETPWTFDGITVDACSFEESLPFMERHYGEIFGSVFADRFLADPMTEAKMRFGREMDVFVYRDEGREIGVLAGHPSDWTSYYMRTVALLPAYRDRHLLSRTMEQMTAPLAAVGCERIDGEVAPTNVAEDPWLTRIVERYRDVYAREKQVPVEAVTPANAHRLQFSASNPADPEHPYDTIERGRERPVVVVYDDRQDRRQATGARMTAAIVLPDRDDVAEDLQRGEALGLALVLEQ